MRAGRQTADTRPVARRRAESRRSSSAEPGDHRGDIRPGQRRNEPLSTQRLRRSGRRRRCQRRCGDPARRSTGGHPGSRPRHLGPRAEKGSWARPGEPCPTRGLRGPDGVRDRDVAGHRIVLDCDAPHATCRNGMWKRPSVHGRRLPADGTVLGRSDRRGRTHQRTPVSAMPDAPPPRPQEAPSLLQGTRGDGCSSAAVRRERRESRGTDPPAAGRGRRAQSRPGR